VCQNALIIEWLDSVKIYVLINYILDSFNYEIKDYIDEEKECERYYSNDFNTIQESTRKAIIKANEIYNNINK